MEKMYFGTPFSLPQWFQSKILKIGKKLQNMQKICLFFLCHSMRKDKKPLVINAPRYVNIGINGQ